MRIKIIEAPDNELGDIGTSYIETDNSAFIDTLKTISNFRVMSHFLDENTEYFIEYTKAFKSWDLEIDLTDSYNKFRNDRTISLREKMVLCSNLPDIPKVS